METAETQTRSLARGSSGGVEVVAGGQEDLWDCLRLSCGTPQTGGIKRVQTANSIRGCSLQSKFRGGEKKVANRLAGLIVEPVFPGVNAAGAGLSTGT